MKRVLFAILITLVASSLTGCYLWQPVGQSQVGLELPDGVSISRILPAGRYSNGGFYAGLERIDVSAKTSTWSDPSLVTKDKQPIGLEVAVTYARKKDNDSIMLMWTLYRSEATDDQALADQAVSRIPAAAKSVTTEYTLDEMLGVSGNVEANRRIVTDKLFTALGPEYAEFGVELLDVRIKNIEPDPNYLGLLSEKAQIQLKADIAKQQTLQLAEQLKQEEAKTSVEMEIATRQNKINEELSKAFNLSPQYFELRRLELLKDLFGDGDVVAFIPQGSPLSIILGQQGIVPVNGGGVLP